MKLNRRNLLDMDIYELMEYIENEFFVILPNGLISTEDLEFAGKMLGTLTNSYSYLANQSEYAKIVVREQKGKIPKEEYQTLMGKRDIIERGAETVKMQYQSLSRMITVKQEINHELRMSEVRY